MDIEFRGVPSDCAVWLAAAILTAFPAFSQQEFKDYRDVKLSDLLEVDVTTASRVAQPLLETPLAITVIDSDEIESYGVQSIPELLRDVVGMSVIMYDSGDHVVAMRGHTFSTPTNNVLVLIDGRNMYQNFYGFVLWDALPISVDEIDRIEVIRGPASSVYGANAMMGVVNIITKNVDAANDGRLAVGVPGIRFADAQLGSSIGPVKTRVALSYSSADSFSPSRKNLATRVPIVNITAQLPLSRNRKLTFFAAATKFDGQLQVSDFAFAPLHENFFAQAAAAYESATMTLRAYWNRTRLRSDLEPGDPRLPASLLPRFRLNEDVFTIEYQQSATHAIRNASGRVVWGAEMQTNAIDATFIDRSRSQLLFSGFGQEEIRVRPNVIVMVGARFDHHPVTQNHYSPRGSLTYVIKSKHALRIAYGEAYRNPSILETYGCIAPRGSGPCSNVPLPFLLFKGSTNLAAESVRNYEVGYRGALSTRLSAGVTYYTYRDTNRSFQEPINGSFFGGVTARNLGGVSSSGVEIEADAVITNFLRLRANYRLLQDPIGDNGYRDVTNLEWNFRWKNGFQFNVRNNLYGHRIDAHQNANEKSNLFLTQLHGSFSRVIGSHEWSPYFTIFNATDRRAAEIVDPPSNVPLRRTITVGFHVGS